MLKQLKQKGFSAVELVLVLVIVGVVIFLVMNVIDSQPENNQTDTDNNTESVEPINDSGDLEQAENELNELDLEELDTSELEAAEDELL